MNVLPALAEDLVWLASRTKALTTDALGLKVTDKDGRVRGMVAFDGWTDNAAEMHIALDTPIAGRRLLVPAFCCAFISFDLGLVTANVRATNTRSRALVKSLRFAETGKTLDGWAPGESMVRYEMRRENCPWLPSGRRAA